MNMEHKIYWTESGKEHTKGKEKRLQKIFESLIWQEFTEGKKEGMMPAMAISGIIKQLKRKPLRYAISHDLAPFGLYGIEFDYTDAWVKTYWLDDGVTCYCLASEPTYKAEAEVVKT
jgi:hypothetical protein